MKYNNYIPLALEYAKLYCGNYRFRHVSIILSNKSVVAIGTNSYSKTHPFNKIHRYRGDYIHSELDAYCKVRHKNQNLILLNFRFDAYWNLALAKPCKYCLPWTIEIFHKIYYSTNDNKLEKLY